MFGFNSSPDYVTKTQYDKLVNSIDKLRFIQIKQIEQLQENVKQLEKKLYNLQTKFNTSKSVYEKYPTFYNGFKTFLTSKQLEYIVPVMDRIGSTKEQLIISLFTTLKRKTAEDDYCLDEIFSDRFKFTISLIEYFESNRNKISEEWKQIITDNTI